MKPSQFDGFEALPADYVALLNDAAERDFFSGFQWFRRLAETTLAPGERVRIYGLEPTEQPGRPLAALVTRFQPGSRSLFKPLTLHSLSNYYTSLFGPVLRDQHPPGDLIFDQLAAAIYADSPRWDVIDLKPFDVASPVFTGLAQSLQKAGLVVQTYFCFGNWYLPVKNRAYQEYLATLPSAVQNTIKRKQKKLQKPGNTRLEIITGGERLEAAIQGYEKVYAASWKIPEPYPQFIRALIHMCAERDWLRLGLVTVDGEPAAAQIWIVNGGKASIYKLAYDERFTQYSAGTVLTASLMEHVIDVDKVEEIDYLTGDDPYKKNWMSHRRERWGILAMNPRTAPGALAILRNVGGRAAKSAFQKLLGKTGELVAQPAAM